ncbi:ImmA/IrrE family metallo-endopeptidase [Kutzneria chonburiensis]|uniref:ImmA/IrrE family metallo-endopeptidase n=2 Tax=Kutzneria chonburiensis TaxID=1483604 RepID=A0ABV6MNS5_9PSEU|nr:ImmA/IrrE family metallo-endopeptidase [Kutzneria chonburiensis]
MELPINHEIVASMRGVVRIEEAPIPVSGFLSVTADGLVITLRITDSRGRRRFTVFHEVMHTFLPGFGTQVQYRCTPGDQPMTRDTGLEQLCDLGAAELMFPRRAFTADLAGRRADLDLVEDLAARYDGSAEATARRVASLHADRTMLLVLVPGRKPSAPRERPQLRVRYAKTGGSWPFVPRHKSVPEDGVFGRALRGEMIDEIVSSLGALTSTAITDVHVSARSYPYVDDRGEQQMRVLALITPATSHRTRHGD